MSRSEATFAVDQPLLEACEEIILDRPVENHHHAARICAVLAEDLGCGPRSDGRDLQAMSRLRLWLGQQGDGPAPSPQLSPERHR